MACPTCDAPMFRVGGDVEYRIFVCPQCGTVRTERFIGTVRKPDLWKTDIYTPRLVKLCREFEKKMGPEWVAQCGHLVTKWKELGIAESINRPEAR